MIKNHLKILLTQPILRGITKQNIFAKRKLGQIVDIGWEEAFLPRAHEVVEESISIWRTVFLAAIFMVIFAILFIRVFHLQVVMGAENRDLADSNRIQIKVIHAPRGVIYDRNGKILAENNPGFRWNGKFVSRDDALKMEAVKSEDFNTLEIDAIRHYPLNKATAHVLGYVGEISAEELKDLSINNQGTSTYKPGDYIGRSGLEKTYEKILRGQDGAEIIEIDAQGYKLRTLRKIEPVPGQNLYLSLDAGLQQTSYRLMEEAIQKSHVCCGVLVAEEPKSGEILSLVSFPSFDSNSFSDPKKNQETLAYVNDPSSPMLNRAIAGTYPPGSTFKITSALAGLSSQKINPQTKLEDTGVIKLEKYTFANWYFTQQGKTEGMVDIVKALQRSNDTFFYQLGNIVGEKILGDTAKKLGIGKKLGIDLPGEADGLVPTKEWKKENVGDVWYPGDTYHLAIGQGYLLATPLQINSQTAVVASSGYLVIPHLVTKITSPTGNIVKQFDPIVIMKDQFKQADIKQVKMGLSLVPKEGGTAWPFFDFPIATAGKTGTAEFGDPKERTHAWYTSYAPEDEPRIVVTALVEAGGEGSSVAAPIVRSLYAYYFSTDKKDLKNLQETSVSESAKMLGE